jgi:hypothetical protein
MGLARRSENLRREGRSVGGGTEEARRGVASLCSDPPGWETSEVCTTPCTTTSVPAAGKLRLASGSGGGGREGSGGVAGLSMTLNASELSRLRLGVSSCSTEVDGKGAGSWLRARESRGEGEDDEADGDAEEEGGERPVAVLWRGTELDLETLSVEESEEGEEEEEEDEEDGVGPTRAVLGKSFALAERASLSSFSLPFWLAVGAGGSDIIRVRDGPPSWGSSSSGYSWRVLAGSLVFRPRRSNIQRLWALEAWLLGSASFNGVR